MEIDLQNIGMGELADHLVMTNGSADCAGEERKRWIAQALAGEVLTSKLLELKWM